MDPIYSNNISFKSKIEYEELITEICNKKITEYTFWHNNDYYMVQIELQKTTAKMAMKEKEYDCIKEKFEKLKKEKEGLQVTNDQMTKKLKEFTLKEKDYKNKIELIEEQLENKSKEIKNLQEINGQMKIKEEDYKKQIKELTNETKKPKDINHFNIYAVPEIETFHIIKKIGKGGSSEVFEVTHGENYALKIIDIDGVSSFINRQRFIREYEVLNELNHPNIIKVFGICNGDETHPPSIVLELCPSNLSCQIKSLNDIERISIIIEICSAMKEVHKAGIIHRDLKLENILLDKNNHVKLSDFSICTFFDNNGSMNHTQMIGTLKFMAPEIILEQTDYNEKIDVYSFGVVFFLILTKGEFPKINIVDVGKGKKAEIPKFITEFSRDLINLCWSFDPKERPSFDDIYRNLTENKNKIL